jgi:sulfotransferase family protein
MVLPHLRTPVTQTSRSAYRVLYIAGTGRSGSTLVAQSLAQSTRSVHAGEVRYIWQRGVTENHLCECGVPFDRCEFWSEVVSAAYGSELASVSAEVSALSNDVDRIRRIPQALAKTGPDYRERTRRYGDLVTPLYDAIAAVSGAELVIDSSKDPSYLYLLSVLSGLDVAPVHLVRDPRAVAYSWTRRRRRPEIHWEERYMRTIPPRRAALIWLAYNSAIEVYVKRLQAGPRVRYEDFSNDPDATIREICRAVDVPTTTSPAAGSTTGHSLSGNPMRFARGPVVVRADDEWKQRLPIPEQRVVTALALPLMRRYGYRAHSGRNVPCAS